MATGDELGKVERVFDRLAEGYDRQINWSERVLLGHAREWAVAQTSGAVLEIGVGTGLNLPLYGPAATSVIAIDLSEKMLRIARDRVPAADGRIMLRRGDVQQLDVPDGSVDTAISTYTFCTIPDPRAAAREVFRVLRPGGRFILAEHGPVRNRAVAAAMRLLEPMMVRLAADHLTREPVPYLTGAGFVIESLVRTGRGGITFRVMARKPEFPPVR
ncbi:class I SAM-dependent methyltransferase [Nocardia huaxiensis]|uniref:class I SAM-dependent methyltransferase n=1 Tax=Nocardia huaxiensis TaxID=2755382 RepID=UPI001E370374|nr:class I SAM-dependent methyltransferase [Nocardia huaxiensis]UFS97085.1 class I SAM-dependent methyltransferase [Nocardia huaxiensis]